MAASEAIALLLPRLPALALPESVSLAKYEASVAETPALRWRSLCSPRAGELGPDVYTSGIPSILLYSSFSSLILSFALFIRFLYTLFSF